MVEGWMGVREGWWMEGTPPLSWCMDEEEVEGEIADR